MKKYYLACLLLAAMLFSGCSIQKDQLKGMEDNTSPDKDNAVVEVKPAINAPQPAVKNPAEVEKVTEQKNNRDREAADYKSIKDREKSMPYAGLVSDDYKRIISLDELAARIAATYKFLEDYPDSPYREEISKWRSEYLHDYMFGNFKYTSSFQWMDGSNIFSKEYLKSYEDSQLKYKGTAFASLLNEYTALIKNEGNKMTDKVRAFVSKNSKDEQVIFKLPS
ncbi:MAG: hypothetical protein A4E52_02111 [Pelotomaculum sp. PtaB.Bin013]|uniref:Lipoprotein n=1 Tax=Pelotomaculum isophthalicicum JI TaxID=947010 RepID=A0A9X4H074_9FIRM|nr:hypothetical protein [Pelotomaculum isophthalicicum]MDF9409592.1 hypothetical protein [Pelotomaculum isophthalicicum JI]OPX82052.1 MAG: hypothetical protein A4E52_02111 [Pelotomaculum sp. PtaB.Bin013]